MELNGADYLVLGILLGLGVFFFLRAHSRHEAQLPHKPHQPHHPESGGGGPAQDDLPGPGRDSEVYRRGQQAWEHLSSKPRAPGQAAGGATGQSPAPARGDDGGLGPDLTRHLPPPIAPQQAGFDTVDFLQGAKVLYPRLHESLALSDWDDVALFVTPRLLETLCTTVSAKRHPPQVLFVEAGLEKAATAGSLSVADVVFASLMELEAGRPPQEVQELWRFERDATDAKSSWRVSSMQRRR